MQQFQIFKLPLSLSSVRPSFQPTLTPSVRPSFQPALYSSVQLSNLSSLPPSLYFSIHSFDFPLFRLTVCRPVLPTLLPCSRWLPSCSWPSLPRSVGPFFYTVVLSLGWLVLLTWGTRKGSTTRLFTAMTWRSPSNAYSDREGSSWNKSTQSHKNKFSMHSFPYATIRTSREYN